MTGLTLGVIGHVDHGKTALVRSLTGIETDRLPEEKARGISIALGFAHMLADDGTPIDLIDMPGHERFVRTMIAGAAGIDAVLLVVAANEGIKPQTAEHVAIAGLLGVRQAVAVISKADLVDGDALADLATAVDASLIDAGLEASPALAVSALTSDGMGALRSAISALAAAQRPCPATGSAFLPIDRAFSMAGHGTVVTGTLSGGAITAQSALELLPYGRPVRIRGLQVHGQPVRESRPGQRVAINLRDVGTDDVGKGMALASIGALPVADWLSMALRATPDAPPIKNGRRVKLFIGTDELDARLRLLDRDVLEPGDSCLAQIHCARSIAVPARTHGILRIGSPASTVAGGMVIDPDTRRQRRHDAAILARLAMLHDSHADDIAAREIALAGRAGTTLAGLARLTGLLPETLAAQLRSLPVVGTRAGLVVSKEGLADVMADIARLLATLPAGLAIEPLRKRLPGTGTAVLDEALRRLIADGQVAKRGDRFVLPNPDADSVRAQGEAARAAQVAETLRKGGLTPPRPDEIQTGAAERAAVARLLRDGTIIRAVDRAKGKEILFHSTAIDQARTTLAPLLADSDGLLVSEICAALGISRKFAMPLLDHLDTIRFTRRVDDRRTLHAMARALPERI